MIMVKSRTAFPAPHEALPGRDMPLQIASHHAVFGGPLLRAPDAHEEVIYLGMGCYWGAERLFWQHHGVVGTAVGNMGGLTPNPTYEELCTGLTGHAEVVRIVYDGRLTSTTTLLKLFFEKHDPTQGMRQGADVGTQYRSVIFTTTDEQAQIAHQLLQEYGALLRQAGYAHPTTDIQPASVFYPAEAYHQQYLHKNPHGYCGLNGTGISCPL